MVLTQSEAKREVTPARINNLKNQIINQFTNGSTLKNLNIPVDLLENLLKLSNSDILNSFSHDVQDQDFHSSPSTAKTTLSSPITPARGFHPNDFRSLQRVVRTSSNAIPLNRTRQSCLRKPSAPKKQHNRRVHFHPSVVGTSISFSSPLTFNRSSNSSKDHPNLSTVKNNSSDMGRNDTNNNDNYNRMTTLHYPKPPVNTAPPVADKSSNEMSTHIRSSSSSSSSISSNNNKRDSKKHIIFITDNSTTNDDKQKAVKPNQSQPFTTFNKSNTSDIPKIKIEPESMDIDDHQKKMESEKKQDTSDSSEDASSKDTLSALYNFGEAVESIYQNFVKSLAF